MPNPTPGGDIKLPQPQPTPVPPSRPSLNLDLPPARQLGPRKKRRWLWFAAPVAALLLIIVVGIIGATLWYNDALLPRSASTTSVRIDVQPGASTEAVGQELQDKGVIKSSLAFTLYAKLNSKNSIKTGTYFFTPNQPLSEIVQWLNDGRVGTRKVTILPGQTLAGIKQELIGSGYTASDVDAAFAKTYNHPLFSGKPAGTSLEGYIFPETYFVTADSTADQLLVRTFDEFQTRIDAQNLRQGLAAHGFSLYQGITLASMVAKEVTNTQDQRQVAQVFELRLQKGIALGSDVTYQYAAKLLGIAPSPDIDSPYNTRKNPGLPPGPIANFNLGALQAVASPASGDYLFFVAGDDGVTHYALTEQEHEQNIQKYCQKLCTSN